jgi:hypothetical protein
MENIIGYLVVPLYVSPGFQMAVAGVAPAYIGSHLSVFNDAWCTSPSILSHEIGHNFRLRHAHENGVAYGDVTGIMGTSFL